MDKLRNGFKNKSHTPEIKELKEIFKEVMSLLLE